MNSLGYEQSSETSSNIPYPEENTHRSMVISTGESGFSIIDSFPQERVYVGEVSSARASWPRRNTAPYPSSPPVSTIQSNRWSVSNDHLLNHACMVARTYYSVVYKV